MLNNPRDTRLYTLRQPLLVVRLELLGRTLWRNRWLLAFVALLVGVMLFAGLTLFEQTIGVIAARAERAEEESIANARLVMAMLRRDDAIHLDLRGSDKAELLALTRQAVSLLSQGK